MPLRRKRRSKKTVSPFPSPETYVKRHYTHSSEIYSSSRPTKRRKHCKRRHRQIYKKRKHFSESPLRRDLRIKHAIEHSIRSHIDRLADYRRNSMLKCDVPHYLMVTGSGHPCYTTSSYSTPCSCTPKSSVSVYSQHKSLSVGTVRRPPIKKRHRKIKEQVIRTEELGRAEYEEDYSLDSEIKRVTESVQNFEKLRKEFLMSLEKMHTEVSSLRLPQTPGKISKTNSTPINNPKNTIKTSSTTIKTKKKLQQTNIKNTDTKQETKSASENVMDNLSKMLMNTSQRPKNKTTINPSNIQSTLGVGATATGGGLMNLAQAFCSMATSY